MSEIEKERKKENILVSVIAPIRNEENYIENFLSSLISQDFPKENLEVVLVDGMSEDKTLDIINSFRGKFTQLKVCSNPNKTVQYALNIGIRNASGFYVVRMDAHSEYSKDYISSCVECLKNTGADNVGGPMIARGKTKVQKVIAAAYHSKFALGGGKFHDEHYEGYADTVYLGAFKKETLEKLNMYDECLPRSEDDDLNFRLIESGGKIFVTPKIKSVYYPRSSYKELFKQYYEYGLFKVAVIKKHRKPARISHLVPVSFVLFMILFGLLSFFSKPAMCIFWSIMTLYFILNIYYSFKNKYLSSFSDKLRLVFVHFILHISYGLGFLVGIFKFLNKKL